QPKNGLSAKLGGGSKTRRILIVVAGIIFILVIVIVLFSSVFKSSGGAVVQLTDLAQQQSEIARVADIGVQKAVSSATKNFAHTTKLTMLSSQNDTLAVLKKSGHKISDKQLALKTNSATDQQLDAASANSTFDATFTKLITDELNSYRTSLQSDYRLATSTNEKVLLQDSFNSVSLLLGDKQSF
ncbi:MAG: hypothetical protein ACXWLH_02880, partial [Candidatus Saccharimonadales bacterium]